MQKLITTLFFELFNLPNRRWHYRSLFYCFIDSMVRCFIYFNLDKLKQCFYSWTNKSATIIKIRFSCLQTSGRPDDVIAAEMLANHIRCNNSFVQAVFQAQFRSSLRCQRCLTQSNTFDPFHCISVQLPQLTRHNIYVTVSLQRINLKPHPIRVKTLNQPTNPSNILNRVKLHNFGTVWRSNGGGPGALSSPDWPLDILRKYNTKIN